MTERMLQALDADPDLPGVRWLELLFKGAGFTVRSTSRIDAGDDLDARRADAVAGVMAMVEMERAKLRAQEKAR